MNAGEIWAQALGDLKLNMSRAQFEQCFCGTRGVSLKDDKLLVSVPSPYMKERLELRMGETVERTVSGIAEQPLRITYVVAPDSPPPAAEGPGAATEDKPADSEASKPDRGNGPIDVEGTYEDQRAEIIKHDHFAWVTDYFRTQWVPLLGPVLAWVVVDLRRRAFWNRRTGERREGFRCTLDEIGHHIGVTQDTVWRALKRECHECEVPHPIIDHFVIARKPKYDVGSNGKKICLGTDWKVRLDEPLTPADERKLAK